MDHASLVADVEIDRVPAQQSRSDLCRFHRLFHTLVDHRKSSQSFSVANSRTVSVGNFAPQPARAVPKAKVANRRESPIITTVTTRNAEQRALLSCHILSWDSEPRIFSTSIAWYYTRKTYPLTVPRKQPCASNSTSIHHISITDNSTHPLCQRPLHPPSYLLSDHRLKTAKCPPSLPPSRIHSSALQRPSFRFCGSTSRLPCPLNQLPHIRTTPPWHPHAAVVPLESVIAALGQRATLAAMQVGGE